MIWTALDASSKHEDSDMKVWPTRVSGHRQVRVGMQRRSFMVFKLIISVRTGNCDSFDYRSDIILL